LLWTPERVVVTHPIDVKRWFVVEGEHAVVNPARESLGRGGIGIRAVGVCDRKFDLDAVKRRALDQRLPLVGVDDVVGRSHDVGESHCGLVVSQSDEGGEGRHGAVLLAQLAARLVVCGCLWISTALCGWATTR
jgi:hypothetical protein